MSIEETRKRRAKQAETAQQKPQEQTQAAQQLDTQEALQQAIREAIRVELQPVRAELEAIRAALNTIANGVQHLQAQQEPDPLAACSRDSEGEEEQASGGRDYDPGDDKDQGDSIATTWESLLPQAPAATAYTVGQRRQPEPIILMMKSGQAAQEEGAPQ